MPKQVFISYSTDDTTVVSTVRQHLEGRGIDCWMAPRDIVPGHDYAEQIIDAIEAASILLLVLSESSNRSVFVRNEVERAVSKHKVIIPFRIQPILPSRSLEFFISVWQWVDAWEPPLEPKVELLIAAIRDHLDGFDEFEADSEADHGLPAIAANDGRAVTKQPLPLFLAEQVNTDQILSNQILSNQSSGSDAISTKFVAHEREMAQLESFLASMMRGQGQVAFLTGEAGAGKSTLMQEFIRRAQQVHPDLVVALGIGKAYAGIDDPYLPFREVLALLSGEIEDSYAAGLIPRENASRLWYLIPTIAQILAEHGPDLVGSFVAGRPLVARAALFGSGHTRWLAQLQELTRQSNRSELERGRLFSQYTDILQEAASQRPLVLALDDLQWADASSLSLLFHLGRSIGGSRILILGAYRTEDIALGRNGERHPLEDVMSELRRQRGEISVHLSQESESAGRHFVDALLDSEPNRLDAQFRQTLHNHTGGHPLFTVELLRDLQERGVLAQDESGRWMTARTVDWKNLPPKVAGVIEKRIGRLDDEARTILSVASIEGVEFTAEVVARVHGVDPRQMLRSLTQLEKRHRVIRAQGEVAVDARYLSRYRFVHSLFQQHLYDELALGERRLLHGEVAEVLETLYGEESDEIAVQLARHYTEAGIREKAAAYLLRAGDRAYQLSAGLEALRHYQQALALAKGEEAYYMILARRAKVQVDLFQGKEAAADYEQLLDYARRNGNRQQEMEYLLGLVSAYYQVALDDEEGNAALKYRDLCMAAQALAGELGNRRYRVLALLTFIDFTDYWPESRDKIQADAKEALALSIELGDEELILESKIAILGRAMEWEQATIEDDLVDALQKRRDLVRLNRAYFYLMWTHYNLGNFGHAVDVCDAGIEVATKVDAPPVMYPTLKSFALLGMGRYEEAYESLQHEFADEAHPFGRTFRDLGIAMYYHEVAAYRQAAGLFEDVMERAERLRRPWLREWARLLFVRSALVVEQPSDSEWAKTAQALAGADKSLMEGSPQTEAFQLRLQAEMALAEGWPDEALLQLSEAASLLAANGYRADLVSVLELQARVLLQLQRPGDALALCDEALATATELEYLPMLWRICATKAQALEKLEESEAAGQEWQKAMAIIQGLAAGLQEEEVRRGYLSDPLIVSIINAAQGQSLS